MLALLARVRPKADLRFDITRTMLVEVGIGPVVLEFVASISACRFVPEPEIRTVMRVGRGILSLLEDIASAALRNPDCVFTISRYLLA